MAVIVTRAGKGSALTHAEVDANFVNLNNAKLEGTVAVTSGGTGATDAATARTNLGLGTMATQSAASVAITGGSVTGITDLAIADGGTGASTAAQARTNLGLGSIATQDATSVAITGGSITGITDLAIADGGTGASTASAARANLLAVGYTTTTGSAAVPSGTTAQRDASPATGYFRFNSTLSKFEGYNGTAWGSVGGGATGGGSDDLFLENGQTVTTNYTISAGKNAGSFGPITIANGVTVTVPSGQVWTIV